ncbi:MAG: TetR/AcrR family transcriptional regulator [Streptomyces sp.]|nr:TetR/AcrR family transcriptional regulator [Streptomyces sp.]NUT27650.1 TetR/AcrR family transcriptional regulator [Streptomyces sp.]
MSAPPRTAPSSSRPRRGRELVLAAATALFHERGYDATSMSDIADRLGVTKAALYRHVKGRAELLHAVTAPVRTGVLALLAASRTTDLPPVEALAALLRALADAAAGDPARHALFWAAHGTTSRQGPDALCRQAVCRRLADLLERAAAQGDVRDDLEPRLAARLLLGAVIGPGGPAYEAPASSASVVGLLLDGMGRVPLARPA